MIVSRPEGARLEDFRCQPLARHDLERIAMQEIKGLSGLRVCNGR
jgi:hypothetical protein